MYFIFFGDMRVEKYTLEFREFGQGAKRRAEILRERTKLHILKNACVFEGSGATS